jgi:hypothetical protein
MRFVLMGSVAAITVLASGCASLATSNDTMVRVETVATDGSEIKEATCAINRAGSKIEFKTPSSIGIPKGTPDVTIDCSKPGVPDGRGVLTSRVGGATFGNILIGGGIGIIVDQATGKAYNYPEWVRIVMGRVLGFDRSNHVDGGPTPGKEIAGASAPPTTTASTPAASPDTSTATPSAQPAAVPVSR